MKILYSSSSYYPQTKYVFSEKMCEYRIYDRGPAQRAPFDFFTKNFLRRLPFESQWPPFSPSVNDNDTTQAVRAMRDIIFRKGYHEHLFVCWLRFRNRKRLVISWEKRITAVCQGYIKTQESDSETLKTRCKVILPHDKLKTSLFSSISKEKSRLASERSTPNYSLDVSVKNALSIVSVFEKKDWSGEREPNGNRTEWWPYQGKCGIHHFTSKQRPCLSFHLTAQHLADRILVLIIGG